MFNLTKYKSKTRNIRILHIIKHKKSKSGTLKKKKKGKTVLIHSPRAPMFFFLFHLSSLTFNPYAFKDILIKFGYYFEYLGKFA